MLTDDRSSIASVGNYDYDKMYVYVSANYVEVVLEGKNGIGKNEEVKVPDSVKDAVEYEGCVQGSGWNDYVQNGQIAGRAKLSVECCKNQHKKFGTSGN